MLSKRLNFYQPLSASCQSRAVFQQNQNNKQKHTQCTMGEISPDFHNWQLIYSLFTISIVANKNYLNYLTYVLVSCNHLNLEAMFCSFVFPQNIYGKYFFRCVIHCARRKIFQIFHIFSSKFSTKSNEFSPTVHCKIVYKKDLDRKVTSTSTTRGRGQVCHGAFDTIRRSQARDVKRMRSGRDWSLVGVAQLWKSRNSHAPMSQCPAPDTRDRRHQSSCDVREYSRGRGLCAVGRGTSCVGRVEARQQSQGVGCSHCGHGGRGIR